MEYVNIMVNNFAVDFLVDTTHVVCPQYMYVQSTHMSSVCKTYIFSVHGEEDESNRSGGKTDMKQTKPLSIYIGPMKIDAGVRIGSFEQPILSLDVIMQLD
jgi:hypothetical protein